MTCWRGENLIDWATQSGAPDVFEGLPEDLTGWLNSIETGCQLRSIPELQWADAAIYFLGGELKVVIQEGRDGMMKSGVAFWDWNDFKEKLTTICEEARKISDSSHHLEGSSLSPEAAGEAVNKFRNEHPFVVAAAGVGLVVVGSSVLLPTMGLAVLNAVGFTSGGVAGGSIATGIQSSVYGAFTTGVFSTLQATAATSVAASASSVAAGATMVGAGFGALFFGRQPPSEAPCGPPHDEPDEPAHN